MKKIIPALFLSVCLAVPLFTCTTAGAVGISLTDAQNEIGSLTARVDELAARVESSSPKGTAEERRKLFLTLDKEIDILESEIDLLEDRYELDYLSGTLSLEDYRSLERELDRLEDRLDKAEESLERAFRSAR